MGELHFLHSCTWCPLFAFPRHYTRGLQITATFNASKKYWFQMHCWVVMADGLHWHAHHQVPGPLPPGLTMQTFSTVLVNCPNGRTQELTIGGRPISSPQDLCSLHKNMHRMATWEILVGWLSPLGQDRITSAKAGQTEDMWGYIAKMRRSSGCTCGRLTHSEKGGTPQRLTEYPKTLVWWCEQLMLKGFHPHCEGERDSDILITPQATKYDYTRRAARIKPELI